MKSIFLFLLSSLLSSSINAQRFQRDDFDVKLDFAKQLLKQQPKVEDLTKFINPNFKLDSLEEFKFYFKNQNNNTLIAYLHIESLEIVYVELFENYNNQKALYSYIRNNLRFNYIASEHNCDYMNGSHLNLMLCPSMEKSISIHVTIPVLE